jgi:hypothetical protein
MDSQHGCEFVANLRTKFHVKFHGFSQLVTLSATQAPAAAGAAPAAPPAAAASGIAAPAGPTPQFHSCKEEPVIWDV